MSKNLQDLTLALAGVFQATVLVDQIAKTGQLPSEDFASLVNSLFDLNPPNTLAVFGGQVSNLRPGLEAMHQLLRDTDTPKLREPLRYALGVLHLQKKLAGRKDMLNVIGSRINQAAQQAEHFGSTHENVVSNLANIYAETLSTFRFRIQVNGDYNYLQQQRIANQIRCLLLAAVRCAILWRQVGGNRWQLLLQRKALAQQVEELLRRC